MLTNSDVTISDRDVECDTMLVKKESESRVPSSQGRFGGAQIPNHAGLKALEEQGVG